MMLWAAAAALLVGVACAPVKPPSGIPGRDVYQTSVQLTASGGGPYTVQVTCTLSNGVVLSPIQTQMSSGDTFFHDWRDLDITECVAVEFNAPAGVRYGASPDGPPTSTTSSSPVDCYFYPGGQGNIQTCYFLIQNP
jgi:hypothetical protein